MRNGSFLNLTGPPRSVPLMVKFRVILGGMFTQSGCFIVAFGMIPVWIFTLNSDLMSWRQFRDPLDIATGTILYSKKTSLSVGGSKHSIGGTTKHRKGTPIYANHYSFVGPDWNVYTGVSYKKGMALQKDLKVEVEYPQGKPEISRIRGMRSRPLGLSGLLPVIFPILGIWSIIVGLRKGIRANRLLTIGQQTTGRLKSKAATRAKLGKKTIYKLTFEFTTQDGIIHKAIGETHLPEKLEDEDEEPLLYDPLQPSNAVMLDALPGSPRIDENGNIRAGSLSKTLLCFVLPTLTVLGNAVYIFVRFLAD